MIYRGTQRHKILQFLRAITIVLSILEVIMYSIGVAAECLRVMADTFVMIYTCVTSFTAAFMLVTDLVLGVRMTILVLESVRQDKISLTLKPRLFGTLGLIVAIDFTAVALVLVPGFEYGVMALLLTLWHTLVSLQLLVTLQEGVKRKSRVREPKQVTVLSDVPQISDKALEGSDGATHSKSGTGAF